VSQERGPEASGASAGDPAEGAAAEAPTVYTPPPGTVVDPGDADTLPPLHERPTQGPPPPPETAPAGSAPTVAQPAPAGGEAAATDALIGRTLGGCRLEEKLGQGGMGAAYRARHLGLEKDVVVKVLPPAFGSSPELRERFLREARATAKLSHPNVVHVYDVGDEGGVLYYVMEYVPGESLHALSARRAPLPLAEATRLVSEVARGLAAAHEAGIVHRDVKPANVLVTPKGAAKVVDFGLAQDAAQEGLSASGQLLGTPHYMAPEQASGAADARSDLYALGVVYYKLLTGALPFQGGSAFHVLSQHVRRPAPTPRERRPEVPDSVCAVVLRLLAKDPGERYASAEELLDVLERVAGELGGGPAARVPPPPSRDDAAGRRLVVGAAALGVAGLAAALASAAWPGEGAGGPSPSPSAPAVVASGVDAAAEPDGDGPGAEPGPGDLASAAQRPTPTGGPAVTSPSPSAPPPAVAAIEFTPPTGAVVQAAPPRLEGRLSGARLDAAGLELRVDGAAVALDGGRFAHELGALPEGEHTVRAVAMWEGEEVFRDDWTVRVDATSPDLELVAPAPDAVVRLDDLPEPALTVRLGTRDEGVAAARAWVAAPDAPASVALEPAGEGVLTGRLSLRPAPGREWVGRVPLRIAAEDAAGNASELAGDVLVVPRGMRLVGRPGAGADAVPAFFMDADEVTTADFTACVAAAGVEAGRWAADDLPEHPAHGVSYVQARRFARWRGRRLPTAAEWEAAAGWTGRARTRFPWGDADRADLRVNVACCAGGRGGVAPVGSSPDDVSPWGCRDMAGNVQEWTTADPPDPAGRQVVKGGYHAVANLGAAAVTVHEEWAPEVAFDQFGLRCARSLELGVEASDR